MKKLGKVLVDGARIAIAGYCAYKAYEIHKSKQEEKNKEEEYVEFDDLEVTDLVPVEQQKPNVKKIVTIVGGLAVYRFILKQHVEIRNLRKIVNKHEEMIQTLGCIVDTNTDTTRICIQDICGLMDEMCKVADVNFGEVDIRLGRLERR